MNTDFLSNIAQIIVGCSVLFVWAFRFNNVENEFKNFGYSILFRSIVGVIKISFATLMLVGICYDELSLLSTIGMALFMVGAQYAHYSVKNDFQQRLPSLIFLVLCIFIISHSFELI